MARSTPRIPPQLTPPNTVDDPPLVGGPSTRPGWRHRRCGRPAMEAGDRVASEIDEIDIGIRIDNTATRIMTIGPSSAQGDAVAFARELPRQFDQPIGCGGRTTLAP